MKVTSSRSKMNNRVSLISPVLKPTDEAEDVVDDRQEQVPGFQGEKLENLTVLLVGCGGLGSWYGQGFMRKGVGHLKCCDPDSVELSNLNRQKFYKRDLYRSKAISLAKNLQKEGIKGTKLTAYPVTFQEAKEKNMDLAADVIIAGVDSNKARVAVARHCIEKQIPAVFTAVSEDADQGYVFVQEPGQACFGCLFPDVVGDDREPCPGTPAILDVLMLVGSYVSYAVDSLFMDRARDWNYLRRFLSSSELDTGIWVKKRADCPLCGTHES